MTVLALQAMRIWKRSLRKALSISKSSGNSCQPVQAQKYIPKGVDVFINHCGPDTKEDFVGVLVHILKEAGITTFLDKEDLKAAQDVVAWDVMQLELRAAKIQV